MSRTRNSLLLYLVASPLGYALLRHLHHVLLPFNILQKTECRDTTLLLETYTAPGLHSILDRIVCVLVRFCSHAINSPLCFPMTATLLGLATTSYAIMSVERVRLNNSRMLTPFMVMLGNVIGTGVIAPMLWLPIYGWTVRRYRLAAGSKINSKPIPTQGTQKSIKARVIASDITLPHVDPQYSFAIGLAALFGQFLPVAILVSFGPSLNQRNILAVFQYFPITYAVFEWIVPFFAKYLNCDTKRGAVDGVRLLYVGLASINAFLFHWVWIKWFLTTSSPDLVVKQWFNLFFSFGSTEQDPVTYMLMWDIVALFFTFTYWAWLEDGKHGLKSILTNSILFGPGAGLALYAMKRETII